MALPVSDSWSQSTGSPQGIATYNAAWQVMEGTLSVRSGTPLVYGSSGSYNTARRSGETWSADMYAQVVITAGMVGSNIYGGPAVRCQAGANTSYHVETGGSDFYVSKCLAGTQTVLAGPVSQTFATGDVLRLEVTTVGGNAVLKVFRALAASPTTFTQVGSDVTDSSSPILTAGLGGVFVYGSSIDIGPGPWSSGDLVVGTTITPAAGAVVLAGAVPGVTNTTPPPIVPGSGSLTIAARPPTPYQIRPNGLVYVGGMTGGRAGATTTPAPTFALTGGTDTTPQAGDLVIISLAVGSTGRNPAQAVSGYTALGQLNASAVTQDTSQDVSYKFMSGTPDTTFTTPSTGNVADAQRWEVQVWRNVHPTTPLDVTPTSATGTATGRFDAPSITPVTPGAVIIIMGAGSALTGASYTAPTDFAGKWQTGSNSDTNDCMSGSGFYAGWTSGAYNPAAVTGGTTGANDSWTAYTIALRPAMFIEPPPQLLVVLTGYQPTVTIGTGVSPTITPAAGALVVTGAAPTATTPILIRPAAGSVVLAGTAPTITVGGGVTITPGAASVVIAGAVPVQTLTLPAPASAAIVLTGYAPTRSVGFYVQPAAGAVVLAGAAPTLGLSIGRTPAAASVVLAGAVPTVTRTQNQVLTPAAGALVVTGAAPALGGSYTIRPGAAGVVLAGAVPTVSSTASRTITPDAGALLVTGAVPVVGGSYTIRPGAGPVVLAGAVPTVTVSQAGQIQPAPGALVLTGAAPTVSRTLSVTPGAGALLVAGAAPTVSRTANQVIQPDAASVLLSTSSPILVTTGAQTRTPGAAGLVLAGVAPTVSLSNAQAVTPPAGVVTLAGYAPAWWLSSDLDLPRTRRIGRSPVGDPARRIGGRTASGNSRRLGSSTAPD